MSDSMNGPKSDPMNDDNTDYQSLIEPYLRQALSEQELAAFEAQLLEDEALLNEVQAAEAMRDQLRGNPGLLESKAAEPTRASWLAGWQQWIAQPQSLAACLAIVALAGLPLLEPQGTDNEVQGIRSSLTLQTLRGETSDHSIVYQPPLLLTLDVGPPSDNSYKLQLSDLQSGSTRLTETGLRQDNEGWLRLVLREDLLGEHRIEVVSAEGDTVLTATIDFLPAN